MTSVDSPADRLVTLPPGEPELTVGWAAGGWAQSILRQPNGPKAGQPFKLTFGQWRFLLWWYAVDEDGRWLFDHGVRRLAKGSGKSPFAAVLSLIEFAGPCRVDDLDPKNPNPAKRVKAKPVDMPLVQIAATAESQTKNTMRMVRAFAPKGSEIVQKYAIDVGKTQYYKLPEGTLEVITSSYVAAEGAECSFVVGDETEHWVPSNAGPQLADTLRDNLTKSGSRMVETCNAWVPGVESVAEATWEDWLAQEEGRTKSETRILYDAVVAPPETRLEDAESLRKGLEFVYQDCPWVDVRPIMSRIWKLSSKPDESKRKYLNWPAAAQTAWIEPEQWKRLADPTVVVADGDEVVLFFDGSKSRDATALVGCRVEDGHVFTLGVWEPDRRHDSTLTVDPTDVDRAVRQARDRYDVVAFFADVREWESYVYTSWPELFADDLVLWAAPSARPAQKIAWDMRSHQDEFARAAEACHEEIVQGEFTHDGDSATARHVGNARRRPYRDKVSIGKESPDSARSIDAAVCVIGARMVRRMYLASPKKRRRKTGKAAFY